MVKPKVDPDSRYRSQGPEKDRGQEPAAPQVGDRAAYRRAYRDDDPHAFVHIDLIVPGLSSPDMRPILVC